MAHAADTSKTDDQDKTAIHDDEQKVLLRAGWAGLFGFTTKRNLPILSGAMLSAVIAAASFPVFAIVYGLIFRDYTDFGAGKLDSQAFRSSVTRYCLILTGIASLNCVANSFYFFLYLTFGELQARSARNRIFDALIEKDLAWFETRDTGIAALLPAIQMHIRELQLSLSAPFGEGTQCIVQGLGAVGVAFYYSWNLTLVILGTVPLMYLFQSLAARRLASRSHQQADKLQMALKYITNAIQSIEAVKCFNGERHELEVFTKVTGLAAKAYLYVANLRSIQVGVMQFFTLSVFVQGFWYGSHLVRSGQKDVGAVLTTFWAALMAIQGITGFLPQFIVLQKGKFAGARLRSLMNQMSSTEPSHIMESNLKPHRCPGDVEFRSVTFSYPTRPDEVAIHNISLFFPAGETTFVIGRSGSGKSTLGQLLVRLYEPASGKIFLDGHGLADLDPKWLREHVTLVEQHSVLFNDTIKQNIALGRSKDSVSFQDIKDAVEFCMMDSVIQDLPEGLDTNLGMHGSSLSGGQRQRLALARARIRDTPVLVLDESTSALDYITRESILQTIRQWRTGKTTIIITHDISQIQSSDFVYLLENSELVQEGYRKELEAQPSVFQALLTAHKHEEQDSGDETSSSYSDETDEILSLYDDTTLDLHSPMHRPMSAVFFGQNVLSPFFMSGRESLMETMRPYLDRRPSRHVQEDKEMEMSERVSIDETFLKVPPGMMTGSRDASRTREQRSRPASRMSQHSRRSRNGSPNWPLSTYKEYGTRPRSAVSSRPTSRRSSVRYPRPLSVSQARPQISSPHVQPAKTRNRISFRRSKTKQDPNSQMDSLPIIEIFKSIWPTLSWRSRVLVCAALCSAMVHSAIIPVFAWVFAQLLTTFFHPGVQSRRTIIYSLTILGLAIVDAFATYSLFFLADAVAQSWVQALKVEAMRRILLQPREYFDQEENSISRLAETLDHFAEEARNLPGRFAGIVVSILITICIAVTWSMIISWKLALVALACGPVLFGITKTYNLISSHWERQANEADDVVGQILHEAIVNIRTVRCLVLEEYFRKKHKAATATAINVGIKRALYSGSIFGLNFSSVLFVAILLFWYGAVLVANREKTVSQIMETFLILMLSVNHINYIGHYITQVNMSRVAGSRLIRLARMPTTSHELAGDMRVLTAGDITFTNVNFTYPTRKDFQVLHDVSFTIPRGSCTAIVGSSGSGKSTIAALLLKLYETDISLPTRTSKLTISDIDIKTLHTTTLRSHMAIVSQTPTLFPGTIAENITYALDPSSSLTGMESIRTAADAAGVSDFIDSLPQGYHTLVGEGGTNLSGGQAQRIAIARALVRRPDILILDEATSALDIASAAIVRDTVRNLVHGSAATGDEDGMSPRSRSGGFWGDKDWRGGKGKEPRKQMTVIIITHAREMMAIADHVIMMEKGRVVEQGSFTELKKMKRGPFAKLLRGEAE